MQNKQNKLTGKELINKIIDELKKNPGKVEELKDSDIQQYKTLGNMINKDNESGE